MKFHVFQCFNECENKKQFSKTVEALGEYIAKKLKYPGNMVSLTKDFVRPEIPKPTELEVSETNNNETPQDCARPHSRFGFPEASRPLLFWHP